MEGDSTGDIGDSLMFDFDFDEEVPLIENTHCQAHPSQQNETVVNLSNDKLGSSSTQTKTTEDLSSSLKNASNVAPMKTPTATANRDPPTGTSPPANRPTTESSELPPLAKENIELPLSDKVNTDGNLSGHEHIPRGATKTPLSGAPQPHVSTMREQVGNSTAPMRPSNCLEHVERGSSSGSNQSLQNYSNSSQNLSGSTFPGFGGTDASAGNGTNVQQTESPFFHSPLSGTTPQQFPPVTVEMIPNMGVVPPFNSEDEINLNSPNHLITPVNGLQNVLSQQGMNPVNLSSTLAADQLAQNQPALLPNYPTFPQSSTRLGTVNPQLPPPWFADLNAPYMTPPRPLINPFQATANMFDPQCANPMLPAGSSMPLRPQHPANHLQLNQVPENVLFNPHAGYPMMPGYPMPIRPQHLPYQPNQFPMAPNVQDPQRGNNMLPAPTMALSFRPPEFFQLNQAAVTPDHVSNVQSFNSLQPRAPFPPMIPELNDHNQTMPPETQMLTGPQTFQELLNHAGRPSMGYPIPGNSQLNPVLNSSTQQEIGGNNPAGTAFPQLELSLSSRGEQIHVGRRRGRRTSRYELRDSSLASKRYKTSKYTYENGSTSQSQENQTNNPYAFNYFNIPRPLKNTVYDPIFESIGLPIDPHLRLFKFEKRC